MAFTKGMPRPIGAGRKKGQGNKSNEELRALIKDKMPTLTKEMLEVALDPATKIELRIKIWEVAMRKVLPDLTSVAPETDTEAKAVPLVINITPPTHDSDGTPLGPWDGFKQA